jgi:xylulokinase
VHRVLLVGGGARSRAVQDLAPGVLGVPVEVPTPGEYVALGAARQAAWVLSRATEPPAWERPSVRTVTAPAVPDVREGYAAAREEYAATLRGSPPRQASSR